MISDEYWMQHALDCAQEALQQDEVPVGAVLVRDDQLIARGWNQPITTCDPTAHAEIVALRHAAKALDNYRLPNTTLYVTLEPCLMCLGAIIHARVARVVFGAKDPKSGAMLSAFQVDSMSSLNHRIIYTDSVLYVQCGELLTRFFRAKR